MVLIQIITEVIVLQSFPRFGAAFQRGVIRRDKITSIKMKLDDNAPRAQLRCYSNELLFSSRSARLWFLEGSRD